MFCEPCRKIQQEIEDHKRFVYEKGADIYVKLVSKVYLLLALQFFKS